MKHFSLLVLVLLWSFGIMLGGFWFGALSLILPPVGIGRALLWIVERFL